MPEREKVIRALENCNARSKCRDCPWEACEDYNYPHSEYPDGLIADALALLKAQEPRVMTLEEARSSYVIEYRSGNMREVGASILDIDVDPANDYYGEIYRVWTSRPTEEQREAVKWE